MSERTPWMHVRDVAAWLWHRLRPGPQSLEGRRRRWRDVHQDFELGFHREENYRWDDKAFLGQWGEIFGHFMGLRPGSFAPEDVILDVGCGSRPAFDWFSESGCTKYHLDPLLRGYLEVPEVRRYWEGKDPRTLLAIPAEDPVEALYERCRFVNCWNVLDHTYDWRRVLTNITHYAQSGAQVCLGTDIRPHGAGHPGIDNRREFEAFIDRFYHTRTKRGHLFHREIALHLVRNDAPC